MYPQERKAIYEEMLADFEADVEYKIQMGFCRWLFDHYELLDISNFPELLAQRPLGNQFGRYWWEVGSSTDGREKRIKALKKALKQTKQ